MNNIIEDVSKLTTIPIEALNKLNNKAIWCICDSFQESVLNNKESINVNIGLGNLTISNYEDTISYKFTPSEALENAIRETAVNKKSPLELTLEKTLANKIVKTYKNIL